MFSADAWAKANVMLGVRKRASISEEEWIVLIAEARVQGEFEVAHCIEYARLLAQRRARGENV